MIKRAFLFSLLLGLFLNFYGQDNVVVLVDVSRSIRQTHFEDAKDIISDILVGNGINNPLFAVEMDARSHIRIGTGTPLIGIGLKLLIIPFGEAHRMNGVFSPTVVNRIPEDVLSAMNIKYPTSVTDQQTYLKLAEAKAAQIAKSQGMNTYVLLLVSDNINDDYGGPNSRPFYTELQRHLLDNFATLSNPYVAPEHGKISYSNNPDYNITISHVNITDWSYSLPTIAPGSDADSTEYCQLRFVTFGDGRKGNEKEVNENKFTIRWVAESCPQGTKFKLTVRSTDGHKENNLTREISSTSYSLTLPDGAYQISVSSPICVPDTTYIKVKTRNGGGAVFLVLLILGAAGFGGYWLYQRQQQKKMEKFKKNSDDDSDYIDSDSGDNSGELTGF